MIFKLRRPLLAVPFLALALGGPLSAHAQSLSQIGSPEAAAPQLKTYGADVPIKSGLKSLAPAGWEVMVHRSAELPETISWRPEDTWVSALASFADNNNLSLKIDWAKKIIFIRSRAAALEDGAREKEIANAATTPLPSYRDKPVKAVAAEQPAPAVTATVREAPPAAKPPGSEPKPPAPIPLDQVQPTAKPFDTPHASAPSSVRADLTPPSGPFKSGVTSFVGGSVQTAVMALAEKQGYIVSWTGPDVAFPGAVTLFGVDTGEDMKLIHKALGPVVPLTIDVYRGSKVIKVSAYAQKASFNVTDATYSGPLKTLTRKMSATVGELPPVPEKSAVQSVWDINTPEAVPRVKDSTKTAKESTTPRDIPVVLRLEAGESVEKSLGAFFKAQGWRMVWRLANDKVLEQPVVVEGPTLAETLNKVLPQMGILADLWKPSRVAIIRSADGTEER